MRVHSVPLIPFSVVPPRTVSMSVLSTYLSEMSMSVLSTYLSEMSMSVLSTYLSEMSMSVLSVIDVYVCAECDRCLCLF